MATIGGGTLSPGVIVLLEKKRHFLSNFSPVILHWEVRSPFCVEAGDCFLSETQTRGSVFVENAKDHPEWMCGNGSMSWDLCIDKKIAYNVGYGASKPLRESGAFEMFWHAEGMKTAYLGQVIWGGERLIDVVRAENIGCEYGEYC